MAQTACEKKRKLSQQAPFFVKPFIETEGVQRNMIDLEGAGSSDMDIVQTAERDLSNVLQEFREANDEDTRVLLNILSASNKREIDSFKFFCVPSPWFETAYPALKRNDGDVADIGPIPMHEIVDVEASESDQDKALIGNQTKPKHGELKKELKHGKDFYFIGPKTWQVVQKFFGITVQDNMTWYAVEKSCFFVASGGNDAAVRLYENDTTSTVKRFEPIPPTGRFPYESIMLSPSLPGAEPPNSHILKSIDSSHDNADPSEEHAGSNQGPVSPPAQEQQLMLLPQSTTPLSYSSHNGRAGDAGHDDAMDAESTKSQNGSGKASSQAMERKSYASGLGNLGNTCFMNSTLQCLAHTEPLRRYFLSGEYERELNRENPLGTGGELATQFAKLLTEMWVVPSKRRNVTGTYSTTDNYSSSYSMGNSATYPRQFKTTLGKHAEQFVGYDQHDSQELATYLLDALHEDTNRVTKKPYVEKPEQGEDEPDNVAAVKAWDLHLQREDSQVLENFMGQVKSRVQCCEEDCNRVSTTFDPFMYLSVPIPGATDRTMKVTFVPLDKNLRFSELSITLNKGANITTLLKKVSQEVVDLGMCSEPPSLDDLIAADVWNNDIYNYLAADSEIDRIRDNDNTYIYELRNLKEVQKASEKNEEQKGGDDDSDDDELSKWKKQEPRRKHYKLDAATNLKLRGHNTWQRELENYVEPKTMLYTLFNPSRGKTEDQIRFHQRLERFVNMCIKDVRSFEEESQPNRSTPKQDTMEEDNIDEGADDDEEELATSETIVNLQDRCDASATFKGIKNREDIAVLEVCVNKLRQFILQMMKDKQTEYKNGILVQISMRKTVKSIHSQLLKDEAACTPLVLRLSANASVFDLREELAERLSRSFQEKAPEVHAEGAEASASQHCNGGDDFLESAAMVAMRKVPLTYEKKSISSYSYKSGNSSKKLGMIEKASSLASSPLYALPTDESERALVCEVVGNHGTVYVDWPDELFDDEFDATEYESKDDPQGQLETEKYHACGGKPEKKVLTVQDCIQKYCQMEQLEDTEMWYCNRCKKHVRAWKQFHLYKAPPILIVHLKRFHYSASTHRRDKINSFIDFPLKDLDLTDMFSHTGSDTKSVYDCYAVSNHYGGLGGGHYTAYTLGDDGTWRHYDDSRVTSDILETTVVSEAAYVLYYRRQDVPVGQDLIVEVAGANHVESELDQSEISSNHTNQAGIDDMALEDDDNNTLSSRTPTSPMGSMNEERGLEEVDYGDTTAKSADRLLAQ